MAAFCGLVRDRFEAQPSSDLELEHYPGMTERSIEAIVARAPTLAARCGRRRASGRCGGAREPIVLVLVASGHREAAFAACEFVMDLLKTEAVFWKREVSRVAASVGSISTSVDRRAARMMAEEHRSERAGATRVLFGPLSRRQSPSIVQGPMRVRTRRSTG